MERPSMNLSRRGFLAGAALGSIGAAVLAGRAPQALADPIQEGDGAIAHVAPIETLQAPASWSEETDVIIVGTGGAGGAALVSALENGARAIALEKNDIWGGHMQFSTGRGLKGLGTVADTYLSEISAPHPYAEKDPAFCRHIAEVGDDDFDWLAGMLAASGMTITQGMNFPVVALSAPADYQEPEGATALADMAWYQWFPFNARGYSLALQERARELGADIRYSAAVTNLIEDNGAIVGVQVLGPDGATTSIKGTVVLCTGGYSANDAMLRHYLPERKYHAFNKYAGLPSATGDGARMAQGAGAALIAMDDIEIWHGGVIDPELRSGPASFYHPANQLSRIAGLCVNKLGQRFMDESSIQGDLFGYQGKIRSQQLDHVSFTIVDSTTITAQDVFDTFHPMVCEVPTPWFDEDIEDQLARGIILQADTIEELASLMGVDEGALAETVERYNALCEAGEDTDFFKAPIYLHPVVSPPFYAVKEQGGQLINTWGGLKVNYDGKVLNEQWEPIQGLYAAGEVCAYGGELHRVMSAGRWAGASAAQYAIEQ